MHELPFNLDLIQSVFEARHPVLTPIFQFFNSLGDTEGYVCVITLIYVAYDKRLAFRLSVLTILTMSLNHLIKMVIQNPRPFATQGTYAEKWAVSAEKAADLVTEYSTPSGHAMTGASFYTYLAARVRRAPMLVLAVISILLTGLARPYIGVHYLEDILIGWPIGLAIAVLTLKNHERISRIWSALSHLQQIASTVVFAVAMWLVTRTVYGWQQVEQPTAYMSYAGFLTGIVIAFPLEARHINFDPRSGTFLQKALRYVLTVSAIVVILLLLDATFAMLADDHSTVGYVLRYVRYSSVGLVGMLGMPRLCVKLKLAQSAGRVSSNTA